LVDDIHQNCPGSQFPGQRLASLRILQGDESQAGIPVVDADDVRASAFDHPPFGLRRVALAHHNYRLPGNAMEERQAVHPL
jgi:hypothetical protein